MATFTRKEIAEGIERLGQLAVKSRINIELVLVGGALMVLRFHARESTRDVDVAILAPKDVQKVRELPGELQRSMVGPRIGLTTVRRVI